MKLDEIYELWESDSELNKADIANEAVKIPKLHHKYMKVLSDERLLMRKLETQYKQLYLDKSEYFMGTLDEDSLNTLGWEPFQRRVMKADIEMYMNADKDIIAMTLKMGYQKEKITVLESIVKNIIERGWMIRNYIEWTKFQQGTV